MIFTDTWRDYFVQQNGVIGERFALLCKGLDEISVDLARAVSERYFFLAPSSRLDAVVRYLPEQLFTSYEKNLQKELASAVLNYQGRYWLPEACVGLSISVFGSHNGLDFVPDIRKRLEGRIAIDGGAFVGDSALVINEFNPSAIYCFEPDLQNRQQLQQTLSRNGLAAVSIVKAGLGGVRTVASLSGAHSQVSLVMSDDEHGETEVTTIDDFCSENNVDPALIKLDIEGMEYDAIRGASVTITRCRPVLIISIYHSARDFFEIKPFILELVPSYKFIVRRLDPFHPTNETVLIGYEE